MERVNRKACYGTMLPGQVGTDEPDARLELLHQNVRKYGTVFNAVAPGTALMRSQETFFPDCCTRGVSWSHW
jgi:hypothetical protein